MLWRKILRFSLFFLCIWSNFDCQCSGAMKKIIEKVASYTPEKETACVMRNEKRENFFEAADLSNDVNSANHVLRSVPVPTVLSCALECLTNSDCKSILVKKHHQKNGRNEPYECHLVSGRTFHVLTDTSTANDLLYFVRKDAISC
ncbi:uncharacterized protein LOC116307348 [Actinia tenebrosa]|uniref:Uncharacterized protein LOC116307348 n=1 Tax=Actinia tenebrosa TaxID=6105 RepID=A0A6P8J1M3_ACTTE|nr:uncharacterized protein LOC116307348 [Actinia tenebrosa]